MMLQSQPANSTMSAGLTRHGKRKSTDSLDNNERLSKRLSLLNIEQGGARLFRPVASPRSPTSPQFAPSTHDALHGQSRPSVPVAAQHAAQHAPAGASSMLPVAAPAAAAQPLAADESSMQVDDTKFRMYIHSIDDELASGSESDGDGDDAGRTAAAGGKLVFLADIDKHLRDAARSHAGFVPAVPRPVRVNEDGELAGMQLVLYNDPSSLSVAPEHDSVRKAIIDARARIRERQREQHADGHDDHKDPDVSDMADAQVDDDDDSDAMEMD